MRPVSAHQFQVALKAARSQDHGGRAELVRLATALMDSAHSHYALRLDPQPGDLRVPDEGEIRIAETLAINRADQANTASVGDVLPAHAVSWDYLRIQLPIGNAKVVQPVIH